MAGESLLWVSGVLLLVAIVLFAFGRGFHIEELSAFGFAFKLRNPIQVRCYAWLRWPAAVTFIVTLAVAGIGFTKKLFPPEWPTAFDDLESAEMLATEVDDLMYVSVNDVSVLESHYGETPDWVNFTPLLHKGTNKIEVIIENGRYGGCGGQLAIRLNGFDSSKYQWAWGTSAGIDDNRLPDIVCYQTTKTLVLQ